jgi:hypothetical protein
MTLIKRKINSLTWLKSAAIYISVVGGVILSSKPAASVNFLDAPTETRESIKIEIEENFFLGGTDSLFYGTGEHWNAIFTKKATQGDIHGVQGNINDVLSLIVQLVHKTELHQDDFGKGELLNFNFLLDSAKTTNTLVTLRDTKTVKHGRHSDTATGILTANLRHTPQLHDIDKWKFELTGRHRTESVPEPTTIFGSALALGVGGWLKRKKSSQQHKTTP